MVARLESQLKFPILYNPCLLANFPVQSQLDKIIFWQLFSEPFWNLYGIISLQLMELISI